MAKPPLVRTCTSAARKGESLNLGASGPKPMKETECVVMQADLRISAPILKRPCLSPRVVGSAVAKNGHRLIVVD